MPYIDRNEAGKIIATYACKQREGQEYVEGDVELHKDDDTVRYMRRVAYAADADPLWFEYQAAIRAGDPEAEGIGDRWMEARAAVKQNNPYSR